MTDKSRAETAAKNDNEQSIEQWLAARKAEALTIDPATAEVVGYYARMLDPYGVGLDIPPEMQCVGWNYFARRDGSDIWVSFYDMSEAQVHVLHDRIKRGEFVDDSIPC